MAKPVAHEEYWFDTTALVAAPRRKKPLEAISSVLPGKQLSDAQQEALGAFAAANGLHYLSWIAKNERVEPMPSLVLDDVCVTLVTGPEPHLLEIGNHGWRFWKHEGDGAPARRGYIAIRHGLGLPHMFLDSRAPGAATVLGAASAVVEVAGAFNFEHGTVELSAAEAFRQRATKLDVPASLGFTAYVEARGSTERNARFGRTARAEAEQTAADDDTRIAAATALIDGPAAPLLTELATSFDIEITEDWIFAYSNFGELSTLDPELWAWAFGAASRLFDVLAAWGVDTDDIRDQAWYTAESVERPTKVDGALRALKPARRSKLGKLLLGDPDA